MSLTVLKGRVIDGNGSEPIEDGLVAVEDNKIIAVCRAQEYPIPPQATVIELEGGTVLPGFIEGHCHIAQGDDFFYLFRENPYHSTCRAIKELRTLLDGGFTSLREVGGMTNYLKAPLSEGLIESPRIFSAGKLISQTGGHGDMIKEYPIEYMQHPMRYFGMTIADGVAEVRRAARLNFREGADFLKVTVSAGVASQESNLFTREYSDDELHALVEEAENFGTYVSAHAHSNQAIKSCLRCGVKSIEHGTFLQEEDLEPMLRNGAWLVPTFSTGYRAQQFPDKVAPWMLEKEKLADEALIHSVQMAHKAGVTIGFGADFGGGEITDYRYAGLEFPMMVEMGGLSPMEAIVAATKTNSHIIQRDDELGTLEVGKLADIVLVDGNPLQDIWLLSDQKNIKVVIQDGKTLKNIL